MSKVSIKGNASGTGNFSIEAPNSNVDRTLALPDEAGTLATVENLPAGYTDTDALDLFNATGSAPVYACRAWVNYSGTNTIRNSGNISSLTDNGTGDKTINFATAMPSNDYAVVTGIGDAASGTADDNCEVKIFTKTTTSVRTFIGYGEFGNLNFDERYDQIDLAIFR